MHLLHTLLHTQALKQDTHQPLCSLILHSSISSHTHNSSQCISNLHLCTSSTCILHNSSLCTLLNSQCTLLNRQCTSNHLCKCSKHSTSSNPNTSSSNLSTNSSSHRCNHLKLNNRLQCQSSQDPSLISCSLKDHQVNLLLKASPFQRYQ